MIDGLADCLARCTDRAAVDKLTIALAQSAIRKAAASHRVRDTTDEDAARCVEMLQELMEAYDVDIKRRATP